MASEILASSYKRRSHSPQFSDTLNSHVFITNVFDPNTVHRSAKTTTGPTTTTTTSTTNSNSHWPNEQDNNLRHSLEEISKEIQSIDNFLTVSEEVLRRERERDRQLYARERQRKRANDTCEKKKEIDAKSNLTKSPPITYRINSATFRKGTKKSSPAFGKRNSKISSVEEDGILMFQPNSPVFSTINKTPHLSSGGDSDSINSLNKLCDTYGIMEINNGVKESSTECDNLEMVIIDSGIGGAAAASETKAMDVIENTRVIYGTGSGADNRTIAPSSASSMQSNVTINSEVKTQVRHLVRRFTQRANKMKSRLEMPPTPSSSAAGSRTATPRQHTPDKVLNNSGKGIFEADRASSKTNFLQWPTSFCGKNDGRGVLDPQGRFYISWLCVVSLTFLYNAWVIPLRSSFPFQTAENTNYWLCADFCCDIVYLLDVIFIKHRLMYLYEGFWVKDKTLTRKNYMRKLQFKMDILSLIPLDLFYLLLGTKAVFLRTPRLLKIQSFWEFFKLLDRVISSPHMVRVAKTLTYMLYMIHLTACTYYAYSYLQGLGTDRWVFSGKGHPYVRSFAFATKTATSIGKNPKPETEGELLFMTAAWLMGVFVFALLIGQIRDIIATATRSQSEYRQLVDETLEYMRRLSLPADMRRRIKMWFQFTWEQQRTLDEGLILDYLPINLKTDIAISVHIQTLSKVQLFADCEEALLRELVLKLRSVIFLPGDYVCRKGEVGREMYIVKVGQIQVMGGIKNDEVLATLSESSVFGEISLLAINGAVGNRRTADVRSKGFSNLFVLSKSDLNEAIVYYPNAQAVLKRRAKTLMQKNAEREREEAKALEKVDVIIGNTSEPMLQPKLLDTVLQALPEESAAVQLLTQGSKRMKKRNKKKLPIDEENTEYENEEKLSNSQRYSDESEKEIISYSLLESIQKELEQSGSFDCSNLTDSEKASRVNNCKINSEST